MKYIEPGNTRIEVRKFFLGTMIFGEQNMEREMLEQLVYAID